MGFKILDADAADPVDDLDVGDVVVDLDDMVVGYDLDCCFHDDLRGYLVDYGIAVGCLGMVEIAVVDNLDGY
ncbi:hypothetical protein [Absidia glauca]|uniref:Uncharacterized protein n=1 Tax=Absidia glauca TaxID=4829 RepID=A0A168L496_ABSGL|nr:hypothetical protein [Absidia glauca]